MKDAYTSLLVLLQGRKFTNLLTPQRLYDWLLNGSVFCVFIRNSFRFSTLFESLYSCHGVSTTVKDIRNFPCPSYTYSFSSSSSHRATGRPGMSWLTSLRYAVVPPLIRSTSALPYLTSTKRFGVAPQTCLVRSPFHLLCLSTPIHTVLVPFVQPVNFLPVCSFRPSNQNQVRTFLRHCYFSLFVVFSVRTPS